MLNGSVFFSLPKPITGIINPITVNRQISFYIDNGSGELDIVIAASGHVPGCETWWSIPANQRTSIIAPTTPIGGDAIDPTLAQTHIFSVTALGTVVHTVRTETKDTTAPTLVSAYTLLDGNLYVVFSEPVVVPNITGLSLTGTSTTITGVTSSAKSTIVTFSLSAPLTDASASFVASAGNTITDLTSNALAASSTAINSVQAISGIVSWVDPDHATVVSGNVSQLTDQSGSGDSNKNSTAAGAAQPLFVANDTAYNDQKMILYNGSGNHMLDGTWATPIASATAYWTLWVGNDSRGTGNGMAMSDIAGGTEQDFGTTSGSAFAYDGLSGNITSGSCVTPSVVLSVVNSGSSAIYLNSHTVTTSGTLVPGGIKGICRGDFGASLGGSNQFQGKLGTQIVGTGVLSAGSITALMRAMGAKYGITIS